MRRLDFGSLLSALGGLLLVISLFLHWYQPAMTAWTAFEVWDLVLTALALGAIWLALADALWEAPPRDGVLSLLGAAALVIVVSQLINHPPAAQGASLESGAWLALGGSALMAAAGVLGSVDVSLSFSRSSERPERERGPVAAAPTAPPPSRPGRPSPANEAAAIEPEVHDELYPVEERSGPIGADDPELWRDPAEDETLPFDHESEERS